MGIESPSEGIGALLLALSIGLPAVVFAALLLVHRMKLRRRRNESR